LLQPYVMATPTNIFDENLPVEGSDYVTLVIEWDELADDLERQLRDAPSSLRAEPRPATEWPRTLKIVAGVLGAALLWRLLRGSPA
jgi:hypothetical protein